MLFLFEPLLDVFSPGGLAVRALSGIVTHCCVLGALRKLEKACGAALN